ncbi:MAG TPA: 4-hydroxyphenylacetate 3-monooxygenase, oxygenase component [Dehalococcoidia bacterium]|nr:4-hydroxyphenylacetate 3-monooxygenase, oxygenase component [Dehalococcoidia bacterium]
MGARTGADYLAGLKATGRDVWIGGERVEDVTVHPAFRNGARSLARLYDMQHDPALRDEMTYVERTSGERCGASFLIPHTQDELLHRRRMMYRWAADTGGMMGRTPDYLNSSFMAFAAAADYFAGGDRDFAGNVRRYYESIRGRDLCLTHTLINPQANRAAGPAAQADPHLTAAVIKEDDAGIVVRGARMLATLAPLSDELAVFPSTVLKGQPEDRPYAFALAVPCDAPGLRFICRDSFDLGRPVFDQPLAARFEEMDCVVIFDDVHVPWERVFLLGDVEKCNGAYGRTNAIVHMMHQVVTKNVAKAEFILGLASLMVETIGVDGFQHVQEKVAEIITYLETMRACLRAGESDAALDEWGVLCPARAPLDIARNVFPKMYPRMIEILQLLGASGLMATPSEADLESPIGGDIERFYQAANAGGRERVRLFRLAWDAAVSSFGSRQVLYERFFFGDPVRNYSTLFATYDKEPYKERIRRFLQRED